MQGVEADDGVGPRWGLGAEGVGLRNEREGVAAVCLQVHRRQVRRDPLPDHVDVMGDCISEQPAAQPGALVFTSRTQLPQHRLIVRERTLLAVDVVTARRRRLQPHLSTPWTVCRLKHPVPLSRRLLVSLYPFRPRLPSPMSDEPLAAWQWGESADLALQIHSLRACGGHQGTKGPRE